MPWLNLATDLGDFASAMAGFLATQIDPQRFSQTLHMKVGHTYAMRKVSAAKGLLLLSFLLSPLATAPHAHAEPTPQATSSADSYKALMDKYRAERDGFVAQMKLRSAQIRAINIAFKNACDAAAINFKSAMTTAKSPGAKNAAIAARKGAISEAIAVRDAAITALGAEPVPPIEPMKPMKAPKGKSR